MVNEIEIFHIDAFADEAFCGNPAGVILSDSLSENEKQLIAKELNLSETAFISKSNIADYRLQWFTPTTEVDLCGHATIASLHYLLEKNLVSQKQEVTFETRSGIINCTAQSGKYSMQIPVPQLNESEGCKEEILDALDIPRTDVNDLPFIILDNGYLFISVKYLESLLKIKPDFKTLFKLTQDKKDFLDVVVFTTETVKKDSSAHLRFFAPFHGIDEDPVTGSACGPLLLVMQKLGLLENYLDNSVVRFEQGYIMKRNGIVEVRHNSSRNELFISGSAITVMKGYLSF